MSPFLRFLNLAAAASLSTVGFLLPPSYHGEEADPEEPADPVLQAIPAGHPERIPNRPPTRVERRLWADFLS